VKAHGFEMVFHEELFT